MVRGNSTERERRQPAQFAAGDRVRAKNIHPPTHTRLPRYVRGHVGIVERDHGCHVFPDTAAIGIRRESAMALHGRVRRRANCGAPMPIRRCKISIDAFEPYLERA